MSQILLNYKELLINFNSKGEKVKTRLENRKENELYFFPPCQVIYSLNHRYQALYETVKDIK